YFPGAGHTPVGYAEGRTTAAAGRAAARDGTAAGAVPDEAHRGNGTARPAAVAHGFQRGISREAQCVRGLTDSGGKFPNLPIVSTCPTCPTNRQLRKLAATLEASSISGHAISRLL